MLVLSERSGFDDVGLFSDSDDIAMRVLLPHCCSKILTLPSCLLMLLKRMKKHYRKRHHFLDKFSGVSADSALSGWSGSDDEGLLSDSDDMAIRVLAICKESGDLLSDPPPLFLPLKMLTGLSSGSLHLMGMARLSRSSLLPEGGEEDTKVTFSCPISASTPASSSPWIRRATGLLVLISVSWLITVLIHLFLGLRLFRGERGGVRNILSILEGCCFSGDLGKTTVGVAVLVVGTVVVSLLDGQVWSLTQSFPFCPHLSNL